MKGLPIFINMEDKKVLVVGGGNSAFIKIRKLLDFQCDVTVLAKDFLPEIRELKGINIINKSFEEKDIENFFIIVASADVKTNELVYNCAKAKGILCSVSTGKGSGDFIFPAHRRNDRLTVTVSTDGGFPALSKKLCSKIDLSLGTKIEFFERKRREVIDNIEDLALRKKVLNEIIEDDIIYSDDYIGKTENILKRYF